MQRQGRAVSWGEGGGKGQGHGQQGVGMVALKQNSNKTKRELRTNRYIYISADPPSLTSWPALCVNL